MLKAKLNLNKYTWYKKKIEILDRNELEQSTQKNKKG